MNSLAPYIPVILLGILQVLDWYTTRTILVTQIGHEANPIMQRLFDIFGMDTVMLLKGAGVTYIGYRMHTAGMETSLAIVVAVYALVVINNFKVLQR